MSPEDNIFVPETVCGVLERLESQGYQAYLVGGCVRDRILGHEPMDWDICTNARPQETVACFSDCKVIETGIRHGTVTVIWEGSSYEITTFRRDGAYLHHRQPQQVAFVSSLYEDLGRRDFTVNAMAADAKGQVTDLFGGREDLCHGIIRCVGEPVMRFREDALRILRGLRLAAQLEFFISQETAQAMDKTKTLLSQVSGERVYQELTKLLIAPGAGRILMSYGELLTEVLPELTPTLEFSSVHPNCDMWRHTAVAVDYGEPEPLIRWALLLHDLGKPLSYAVDDAGMVHFNGYSAISETLARGIFGRFHGDRHTTDEVATLVAHHDDIVPRDRKAMRRWVGQYGGETLLRLLEVKRADALAHPHTPQYEKCHNQIQAATQLACQLLEEETCFTVKDLAIGGKELLAMGIKPGPELGSILRTLLVGVIEERCPNEPDALTQYTERIRGKKCGD